MLDINSVLHCAVVYLFGSVEEVARIRNISRWGAPDSEGGLETTAHPHSQGNKWLWACAALLLMSDRVKHQQ